MTSVSAVVGPNGLPVAPRPSRAGSGPAAAFALPVADPPPPPRAPERALPAPQRPPAPSRDEGPEPAAKRERDRAQPADEPKGEVAPATAKPPREHAHDTGTGRDAAAPPPREGEAVSEAAADGETAAADVAPEGDVAPEAAVAEHVAAMAEAAAGKAEPRAETAPAVTAQAALATAQLSGTTGVMGVLGHMQPEQAHTDVTGAPGDALIPVAKNSGENAGLPGQVPLATLAGEGVPAEVAPETGLSSSAMAGQAKADMQLAQALAQPKASEGAVPPTPQPLPPPNPTASAPPPAVVAHDPAKALPPSAVPMEIGLKALQGVKEFQIRLDPAELGRVEVKLEVGDDQTVSAKVVVDRVETLHLFQREAKTLERAFEQAGLRSTEGGIDISLRDPGQQSRGDRREGGGGDQPSAGRGGSAARLEAIQPALRRSLHVGALDLSI